MIICSLFFFPIKLLVETEQVRPQGERGETSRSEDGNFGAK